MKTYDEVIKFNATDAYNRYMGGSTNPFQYTDIATIAFMFDKSIQEVDADILSEFNALNS